MFAAHVSDRPVDAPAPDYAQTPQMWQDYEDRRMYAAHKDITILPILGIGADVAVAIAVDGQYVVTQQIAHIVAVEDREDAVYEVWQACEGHATIHKVYAQWDADEVPLAAGGTVPLLLALAPVIE